MRVRSDWTATATSCCMRERRSISSSDRWHTAPRYAIALPALTGKPQIVANARYFRAACREIARSTDERTAIAAILPPGVICGHTINVERRPSQRPNATALTLVAVMNSFAFDWMLRQKAAAHVSLYILTELPSPVLSPSADRFLAHASLRLSCNHRGFLPLWREQLGEASKPCSWPAVPAEQTSLAFARRDGCDHSQCVQSGSR